MKHSSHILTYIAHICPGKIVGFTGLGLMLGLGLDVDVVK